MKDRWSDRDAQALLSCYGEDCPRELILCSYSGRLLGAEPSLVLHGGGNTSVKGHFRDVFGELVPALFIKASGFDLATIEPQDHVAVDLQRLQSLQTLDAIPDKVMRNELCASRFDQTAPAPSVEAILHALIPYRFIEHTHADAIVTLSNTPQGEQQLRSLYGESVLIVPYVMPGFALAKKVVELVAQVDWSMLKGMVLMNHGIFSFADDARESYQRMIRFVTQAEQVLGQRPSPPVQKGIVSPLVLASLRREICRVVGRAMLARFDGAPESLAFASRDDVADIASRGPLTPDHVIRTKRLPLVVDGEPASLVDAYVREYQAYFEQHTDGALTMLDCAPRWAIWPGKGTVAFGSQPAELKVVGDIVTQTIGAIEDAERLGGWCALPAADIFAVEYWELEQAKLGKAAAVPPLQGRCAVVTGGANGIGHACATALGEQGAQVTVLDLDPAVSLAFDSPAVSGIICDVTDPEAVRQAIDSAVASTGGLDIVVSNAGIFCASNMVGDMPDEEWQRSLDINLTGAMHVVRQSIPYLRLGWEPAVIIMGSKNVPAPGPGAGAYSVAKAGLTQLARVLALELATDGIRVNTVHPNAVFDTAIWTDEVLESRAAHYGMSVEAYRKHNLLNQEITSRDVAAMVCAMAGPTFRCTTGAQVPVDGGNERVL